MNIAEQFQQDRYAYIENIITPERASELTQHLFDELKVNETPTINRPMFLPTTFLRY